MGAYGRRLLTILVATTTILLLNPYGCAGSEPVTVSLYYETLCPYCADFIVNHLVKLFQNGLISIVNLRMLPWGNAWLNPDGSFVCQHGADECLLNTIEACTISTYPDVTRHFRFIYCVERLTLQNRHNEWEKCFEMSNLGTEPIDCYNNGYGTVLENKFAKETSKLNPPHRFVPWVVVNNKPLQEDFENFMAYICKAYKGNPKPEACRSLQSQIDSTDEEENSESEVCYVGESRNFTSLDLAEKIPR
ncbi:gamma-interferon-responsive lysosomal thiol protein [Ziziphus jujuba]|uniref:Gamma-interferon-responsive lysosomal thiol protein n=1 Tax=Ziziphus jujuba TaxID=326968 RepID=A0A6P4AQ23_ZIZJJ|nr:gamma-interferon-responsive lysosomal thiol protein [Ziziphus jujuba]